MPNRSRAYELLTGRLQKQLVLIGLFLLVGALPVHAIDSQAVASDAGSAHYADAIQHADKADLESHGVFTAEYVFGLSKATMRSTLEPALKPAVLILTVPLDIAFLPFAVIGGFLR